MRQGPLASLHGPGALGLSHRAHLCSPKGPVLRQVTAAAKEASFLLEIPALRVPASTGVGTGLVKEAKNKTIFGSS